MAIRLGWMFKLVKSPPNSMTHVDHLGLFDASNTLEMLAFTGITCPLIQGYYPVLCRWLANRHRPDMRPKM